MKRSTTVLTAALVLIALAAGGAIGWTRSHGGTAHPVAAITVDGKLVREIDLTEVTGPETFDVPGANGGSNTVQVEPGRIRVSAADCPDHICVDQGFISDGTVPIVCLPHKLMISISGGGEDLDGAAG